MNERKKKNLMMKERIVEAKYSRETQRDTKTDFPRG